jgi:hypothetical protein
LRRGKHHSFILQKAWDKYGEASFNFRLLVVCKKTQRIEYENLLMPLQSYNVLRTAREKIVRGGWSHTAAFKQKMSALHKGVPLSDDHRKKLSEHRLGRVENISFREAARTRQLGVSPSATTRMKLSASIAKTRSAEVADAEQRARKIHALCVQGAKVYPTCKKYGMSATTFYRYIAKLQLGMLGHKPRGVLQ